MLTTVWAAKKASEEAGWVGFFAGVITTVIPALFGIAKLASNLDAKRGRVVDLENQLEVAKDHLRQLKDHAREMERQADRLQNMDANDLLRMAATKLREEEEAKAQERRERALFERLRNAAEEKPGNGDRARA